MYYWPMESTVVTMRYQSAATKQQRNRLERGLVDDLDRRQELHQGDYADQRGVLELADELVARGRNDHADGLGQDDAAHRAKPRHAESLSGVDLPLVDGEDPGAHDLRHVGSLVEAEARMAATNVVMMVFASTVAKRGPKGMPNESRGKSEARLNQKMIWTSSGVPRKNQM